jgi:rhodanese-related sulfurtransferase
LLSPSNGEQAPGSIIFQDDFSDPSSGWSRAVTDDAETDYADGMYRILVNQPNTDIWALSGLDLNDVSVEATALKVGGERDNRFGLICRAGGEGNFYTFIISSDGFWGIGKVRGAITSWWDGPAPAGEAYPAGSKKHPGADCWEIR